MLRVIKVDDHLEVQPELRLHAERAFEAHRGIGRHGSLTIDDLRSGAAARRGSAWRSRSVKILVVRRRST